MSSPALTLEHPPKIGKSTFISVAWGGVVLAGIFFIGRLCARLKGLGHLMIDDLLVLCAWILLFASTVIWQYNKDKLYENLDASAGLLFTIPTTLPADTEDYLKASLAVLIFFYTSLWLIKLSFLFFFRTLGYHVRGQKLLWWTVTTFTATTWFVTFGTIDYTCLARPFRYIEANGPSELRHWWSSDSITRQMLIYNMVADVVTDALIITIPMNLLWRVRISIRQRLALVGIFCLTVLIMIFSVVRVVLVLSWSDLPDESWLWMWSSIERTVSIIVASLASFRLLFTTPGNAHQVLVLQGGSCEDLAIRHTISHSRVSSAMPKVDA